LIRRASQGWIRQHLDDGPIFARRDVRAGATAEGVEVGVGVVRGRAGHVNLAVHGKAVERRSGNHRCGREESVLKDPPTRRPGIVRARNRV